MPFLLVKTIIEYGTHFIPEIFLFKETSLNAFVFALYYQMIHILTLTCHIRYILY